MSTHLIRVDKPSASDRTDEKHQSVVQQTICANRKAAMTVILKQWEEGQAPAHYEIHEV